MKKFLFVLLSIIVIFILILASQVKDDIPKDVLMKKYSDNLSKFIKVGELEVHYKDEGSGTPLLLLHGVGSSLHTWDGWTKNLKDTYRVIRLDLPGTGLTGPNSEHNYAIKTYVNFLKDFLDKINVKTFHVAGNSLGGQIAWQFCLTYPDRITKMILIDSGGFPFEHKNFALKITKNPIVKILGEYITPKSLADDGLKEAYGDPLLIKPEIFDRYYELLLRKGNRKAYLTMTNFKFEDRTQELININIPVLIMWGGRDKWIPVDYAYKFHIEIKDSRVILYGNLGHIPMEESPEKTAKDAKEFFQNG
ncbi:MAG: alpha/beta hydrolase [Desulfobacterales bacterium]|nr:alpha/beta hydrolase [Desulfobacterales bacterium]MBF0397301.1 alpha/beta hydrolase [Desulfobacterales bacterium]